MAAGSQQECAQYWPGPDLAGGRSVAQGPDLSDDYLTMVPELRATFLHMTHAKS